MAIVTPTRLVPTRPWVLLLVDDEPDILDSVADFVERQLPGVQVIRAGSGREGLGVLQDERVDGIISDFAMDEMDGLQFLQIARHCHPTIPRVMYTAYPDPALARLARQDAGVKAFVAKGTDPDELLDRVCAELLHYTPNA